jgi:hypothetical protein
LFPDFTVSTGLHRPPMGTAEEPPASAPRAPDPLVQAIAAAILTMRAAAEALMDQEAAEVDEAAALAELAEAEARTLAELVAAEAQAEEEAAEAARLAALAKRPRHQ